MINVAVIDDEPLARQSILALIGASDLEDLQTIEAEDADDALAKFSKDKPDILIVDIRMPGMDGLALAERVQNEINHSLKVIVVSGFGDFAYSRRAIHLRAHDYILKPVKKADLLNAVRSAVMQMMREREAESANRSVRREALLNAYLDQGASFPRELNLFAREKPDALYQVAVIRSLSRREDPHGAARRAGALCGKAFPAGQAAVFRRGPIETVVFFSRPSEGHDALAPFKTIATLERRDGLPASVGIGRAVGLPEALSASYREASAAAMEALSCPSRHFFVYDESADSRDHAARAKAYQLKERRLLDYLTIDAVQSLSMFPDFFACLTSGTFREADARLKHFLSSLQQVSPPAYGEREYAVEYLRLKLTLTDMGELRNWLYGVVRQSAEQRQRERKSHASKCVQAALDYVDTHFAEDISLSRAAAIAHISPAYFCELFKAVTGETLSQYLAQKRVAMACELLRDTRLKINEIAGRVGYESQFYFSSLFKKATGVSPKEYREAYKPNETL